MGTTNRLNVMTKFRINIGLVVLMMLTVLGCKKMDDTYKEFIKDGEIVYISKPDSLKVFVGRERIQLQWLLISDPKVKSYKVYWNNRADSLQGQVTKSSNVDTVRVIVNNLPEGTYNFEVLQFDNFGNSSVKTSVVGRTYGTLYEGTLYNRPRSEIKRHGNDVHLTLAPTDESFKGIEVSFLDNNSVSKKILFKESTNKIIIPDFPFGGKFTYKTFYAPDTLYVDLFNSIADTYEEVVAEIQSDKSSLRHHILPTDTYQPLYSTWSVSNLWDGISNNVEHIFYMSETAPNLRLPNWFTIDLGAERVLSKVRVNQLSHSDGWLFTAGAPKTYEIYGSNNPNTDGSFTDWDLLGSYTSIKPADYNQMIALGREGEIQLFENNTNSYRYVRFKTTSTWGEVANVMLSELTFFEKGTSFRAVAN